MYARYIDRVAKKEEISKTPSQNSFSHLYKAAAYFYFFYIVY